MRHFLRDDDLSTAEHIAILDLADTLKAEPYSLRRPGRTDQRHRASARPTCGRNCVAHVGPGAPAGNGGSR